KGAAFGSGRAGVEARRVLPEPDHRQPPPLAAPLRGGGDTRPGRPGHLRRGGAMTQHVVIDGLFHHGLVRDGAEEWPGPAVAPWVCYDTPEQSKRTLGCRKPPQGWHGPALSDWPSIPSACRDLLGQLLSLDVIAKLG